MSPRAQGYRNRRGIIVSALLTGLGLAIFGCSGDVSLTGPANRLPDEPLSIVGQVTGTGGISPAPNATIVSPSKTETITSSNGGRIDLGPYSVTFSPGALKTDTEIKVVDVSRQRGYTCVELYPEGIHFDETVTLEMRIPSGADTKGTTIWWWGTGSDGAMRWIDVGGTVSADGTKVSTTLKHFSTYAPGKAGWWKPANPVGLPRAEQGGHR